MNRKSQILLFVSWITIGGILITSEMQVLSFIGWFILGSGLMAVIYNIIQ